MRCSSWSNHLSESEYTKYWPKRWVWHGDRSYGINHPLLLRNVFEQTEKKLLLRVSRNGAVKTPLRRLRQTKIFLALQQLAINNNSATLNSNIHRIFKLPKSLTTILLTFDGKSERFELFGDLIQTNLKIHSQLLEDDKFNYFHSLRKGDALQTFKSINRRTRENLAEKLASFCRRYVKRQSVATATHNFQKLVLNPANEKLLTELKVPRLHSKAATDRPDTTEMHFHQSLRLCSSNLWIPIRILSIMTPTLKLTKHSHSRITAEQWCRITNLTTKENLIPKFRIR